MTEIKTNTNERNSCGEQCEVYSRVTGYFRPTTSWNKGKREEFKERKTFNVQTKKNIEMK